MQSLEAILGPDLRNIVEDLDNQFPPVDPFPGQSIEKIMYIAGQRCVIDWLKDRVNDG